jgi:glycosyltransferase involved in cell wall biosynthesis
LKPVGFKTALLRIFFLLPAATSHAIVVTTEIEARYARRFFPRKPIEVIPAGLTFPISRVTEEKRIATRQKLGFCDSDFVVAYAGFLLPNKGIETLIAAIKQLPPTTKLLVIGGTYEKGDPYSDQLKVAAKQEGVGQRIVWTGEAPQEDFGALLSAADCAALPFDEGGCLKRSTLLMAIAAGLPVVTTDGPERDRVMRSGGNLLLVPARDPQALAAALSLLESDEHLRKRLVENSLEILDMVSWESIVGRHVALYKRLGAQSARRKLEPAPD